MLKKGEPAIVEGEIIAIRYETPDQEFQVIGVRPEQGPDITVVARGAGLLIDEHVRIRGQWNQRPNGEWQVESDTIDRLLPSSREGLVRFLSSSLVEGIGETYARKIVDQFGDETIQILTNNPRRLEEVAGIGKKRRKQIAASWERHEAVRGIMVFLQSHNISPAFANRIYRYYGQRAVAVVKENPYRLARDIRGIGFANADRVARTIGIAEDDPRRVDAAVEYALFKARGDGHVYLPEELLCEEARTLIGREDCAPLEAIERLIAQGQLSREVGGDGPGPAVYVRARFEEEHELATQIHRVASAASRLPELSVEALQSIEAKFPFALSEEQRNALRSVTRASVSVLTGGPGTGKTTIVRALVLHAERSRLSVMLAAPTGRAAYRLSESTERTAKTIHRLLEFDPGAGGFQRDGVTPLETDLLIVDEASMLDQALGLALMRAVERGTHVVFVGDADQLPPVGAGEVFADLIRSEVIAVANLNRVFRQGERSEIVVASHAVRHGQIPDVAQRPDGEFFFIRKEDPEDIIATITELVTRRIPRAFKLDPVRDVQVLSPVHRGPVGNRRINEVLQEKLVPPGPSLQVGARRFRLGEKVMQTRNNYDLDVFNGDIGFVVEIDKEKNVHVQYEGRLVKYDRQSLDDLELAWSISVHKSQGSEFPAVVLALSTHHFKLLQRNLVYTGMTRARRLLVIVGSERAFRMAIDHISGVSRYTMLATRIRDQVLAADSSV